MIEEFLKKERSKKMIKESYLEVPIEKIKGNKSNPHAID